MTPFLFFRLWFLSIINRRRKQAGGKLRLNLASGNACLKGYVNLDISPKCNPDMVVDIRNGLPFPDNSVWEIQSRDFLEHLSSEVRPEDGLTDVIFVLNECHRVLKKGGFCLHEVPYYPYVQAFQDPTHRSFFTEDTFLYWQKEHITKRWKKYGKEYGIIPFQEVRIKKLTIKGKGNKIVNSGWLKAKFIK